MKGEDAPSKTYFKIIERADKVRKAYVYNPKDR